MESIRFVPQQTGKLEIPSITYTGIIEQPNRNIDPFDAFLMGDLLMYPYVNK